MIEVLVTTVLTVVLIIAAYDLYSDMSHESFFAAGKLEALSRARTVEDQFRFYLEHAGLGVPSGSSAIASARQDTLSVRLNSDYFSHTTGDYFMPANTPVNVGVQKIEDTELNTTLLVLSTNREEVSNTPVLQSYDKPSLQLTIQSPEAFWPAKGNYIGIPWKAHSLTIAGGKLQLNKDGQTRIIADGVEAFDVAFLYDPPWLDSDGNGKVDSGEDGPAVWCYDAEQQYPSTYDPDSMQRILDTDLSGDITSDDDQNSDWLIEGTTLSGLSDTDGNGKLNGVPFNRASLARIWILVNSKKVFGTTGSNTYLVGRRILSFNDGRLRIVSCIDFPLRNAQP